MQGQALAAAVYVVLVTSIGFSRLYLEVHYLSDVLAGISLGAAWGVVSLFVYEWRHDAVTRLLPERPRDVAASLRTSRS
jgi:membrane-associated phospholipid phosphatase